jgi:uncharacterized protein (TIGR03435 family)
MRRVLFACACVAGSLTASQGQSHDKRFEVVSIKRNVSGEVGTSFDTVPGYTFSMVNGRLIALIREAYPADSDEVAGVPTWARRDRYDVLAKVDGSPSRAQVREMLQAMLADRFQLATHIERREHAVYFLVLAAPNRPRPTALKPTTLDCERLRETRKPEQGLLVAQPSNGALPCGYRQIGGRIDSGGITMHELATALSGLAGRIVLDRTGLSGRYEFVLTAADAPSRGPVRSVADDVSVFTALQEQLGLKLEAQRAAVETLVVDRIDRPSED